MGVTDKTLATVMTQGIGENLTNDEKRAHLIDLKREHLIDQVCSQKFCRHSWGISCPNRTSPARQNS
jgi:hypothetical protein